MPSAPNKSPLHLGGTHVAELVNAAAVQPNEFPAVQIKSNVTIERAAVAAAVPLGTALRFIGMPPSTPALYLPPYTHAKLDFIHIYGYISGVIDLLDRAFIAAAAVYFSFRRRPL